MSFVIDRISQYLPALWEKYRNLSPNSGGCGYVALFLHEYFTKLNLKSEIIILSCKCCHNPIFSIKDIQNCFDHNWVTPENFNDYGINLLHIVLKHNNEYFDLKGKRSIPEMEEEFRVEIIETFSISEFILKNFLNHKDFWTHTFDRRHAFRIKRDIHLMFKKIAA